MQLLEKINDVRNYINMLETQAIALQRAYQKIEPQVNKLPGIDLKEMAEELDKHDISLFTHEEFIPLMNYYLAPEETAEQPSTQKAAQHYEKTNLWTRKERDAVRTVHLFLQWMVDAEYLCIPIKDIYDQHEPHLTAAEKKVIDGLLIYMEVREVANPMKYNNRPLWQRIKGYFKK